MHSDMHYLLGKALLSRADTNSRTGAASTALAPDIERAYQGGCQEEEEEQGGQETGSAEERRGVAAPTEAGGWR
jgi:hypothetical protein